MSDNEESNRRSRAAIFDFDGLLADTESGIFRVWQELYEKYSAVLELNDWLIAVGNVGHFDPRQHLESITGTSYDWNTLDREISESHLAILDNLVPLPGVMEHIHAFRKAGWKIGVASNSDTQWVTRGLDKIGITPLVDAVRTRDDVKNYKPHPDVYLAVLEALNAEARDSIAFEDSGPGVLAAKASRLFTVAVPNALTRHHDLSPADLLVFSLLEFDLKKFLV